MSALSVLGIDWILLGAVFLVLGFPIAMLWVQMWSPVYSRNNKLARGVLTVIFAIPAALVGAFFSAWLIMIAQEVVSGVVSFAIDALPIDTDSETRAIFSVLVSVGAIAGAAYYGLARLLYKSD